MVPLNQTVLWVAMPSNCNSRECPRSAGSSRSCAGTRRCRADGSPARCLPSGRMALPRPSRAAGRDAPVGVVVIGRGRAPRLAGLGAAVAHVVTADDRKRDVAEMELPSAVERKANLLLAVMPFELAPAANAWQAAVRQRARIQQRDKLCHGGQMFRERHARESSEGEDAARIPSRVEVSAKRAFGNRGWRVFPLYFRPFLSLQYRDSRRVACESQSRSWGMSALPSRGLDGRGDFGEFQTVADRGNSGIPATSVHSVSF